MQRRNADGSSCPVLQTRGSQTYLWYPISCQGRSQASPPHTLLPCCVQVPGGSSFNLQEGRSAGCGPNPWGPQTVTAGLNGCVRIGGHPFSRYRGGSGPRALPNSRSPWALVSMLHRGNSGGNRPFLGTRESAMRSPRQLRRSAAQLFRAALGVFGICFVIL